MDKHKRNMNCIHDYRIEADNYMLQMTLGEYYALVKDSLNDNEYQRKRVRNASSIYNLLKQDLKQGCIMPPIVLAYTDTIKNPQNIINELIEGKNKLKILDGLQRSYTIKEIIEEKNNLDLFEQPKIDPHNNLIRVEVYTGIKKLGILYRMLTLNTGQTQMTTRHQIEIIYSDYKDNCNVQGVRLLSEVDGETPSNLGEYKFKDVVDGFTSYLQKNYLTLDRMDILENVKNLERLSTEDMDQDLFNDFIDSYHLFVKKMFELNSIDIQESQLRSYLNLNSAPYATSYIKLFNKSQSLTGFGNAIAVLKDFNIVDSFKSLKSMIEKIDHNTVEPGFYSILENLDKVRSLAKKIGNDQRLYFHHFFKKLFDNNESSYLNVNEAAHRAYEEYERVVS